MHCWFRKHLHWFFVTAIATTFMAITTGVIAQREIGESSQTAEADLSSSRVATEEVAWLQEGRRKTLAGRVVIEATDGGMLLETDDGVLWIIEAGETQSRRQLETPFAPVTPEKMAERLLAELPAGFRIHTTPHYVVCYNTSRTYAQWTSSLLERLYKAFTNYWKNKGLELREPEFPLAVLVFADRQTYDQAAATICPRAWATSSASTASARTASTCSTSAGWKQSARRRGRRGSLREINQMLSQPAAVPLVATIVHEATHQIAFNCGLQTRFADIPLWLCEGMAVYFEAPDLASTRGWRGIGRVNYPRLDNVSRKSAAAGKKAPSCACWPTAAGCAIRAPPPTPTPTPGRSTTT